MSKSAQKNKKRKEAAAKAKAAAGSGAGGEQGSNGIKRLIGFLSACALATLIPGTHLSRVCVGLNQLRDAYTGQKSIETQCNRGY